MALGDRMACALHPNPRSEENFYSWPLMNRYGTLRPTKLVLARHVYGYEGVKDAEPRNEAQEYQ